MRESPLPQQRNAPKRRFRNRQRITYKAKRALKAFRTLQELSRLMNILEKIVLQKKKEVALKKSLFQSTQLEAFRTVQSKNNIHLSKALKK